MARKVTHEDKHHIVEFLKKDYTEWLSSSDSKISDYGLNRPTRLKTLPQAEGKEVNKVMADLKATLPDISPKDVRRFLFASCVHDQLNIQLKSILSPPMLLLAAFYMQYFEAILLELEEQGYEEAYHQMVEFFKLDDQISERTPGMISWKKPQLRYQKDLISCLKNGFIAYEKCRKKGDFVMRAMVILDTALFFQSQAWEWWWIAERLYQTALSAAKEIENDKSQTITLVRYLYGRFLFNELQNPIEALEHLKIARDDSANKIWNASKKLGIKQGTIFKESNILLFKILLILARKDRPENPGAALQCSIEALQRAQDAGNPEYVNEAYFELGKCYVAVNDIKCALQSFSKLLALAKRVADIEGVCNAHMELAFAYKHLNDNENTEKHLRLCRENAENFARIEKLAHAHYYTGEHYLSQGKLHLSTNHLEAALNLYNRANLPSDADRARCIAGISKGQERIEKYTDILLRCGEYDKNATLKLCRWKNNRESFWTKEIHDIKSDFEFQYEGLDTISSSLISTIENNQT